MKAKCVISISHSNYLYKGAGTEKCMREIKQILKKENVHYLQIFSFEKYSNLNKFSDMSNKIGVNYDENFLGIYTYSALLDLLNNISLKNDIQFVGIHINNVINHDLSYLKKFIFSTNLPITVWLHDYSSICGNSPILLDGNGVCCNNFIKNLDICKKCSKYKKVVESNDVYRFYKDIDYLIHCIIAPSNSVKRNILLYYSFWDDRIVVRPHLKFTSVAKRKGLSYPIRIAYVGGKYSHKGYEEWLQLTKCFKDNEHYEFYYLGSSVSGSSDFIKEIKVDVSEQGEKAMQNAILKQQIDVAFLWSKCQETYSYTYYESFCSGARIITNNKSGNIAEQTVCNKSGIVLNTIDELIKLMEDYDLFKTKIENYDGTYCEKYDTNDSTTNLILNGSYVAGSSKRKVKPYRFLMLLYLAKNNLIRKKGKNAR